MDLTVKMVGLYTQDRLMQEHLENIALISRIKNNVAEEYDNLAQPIPFSASLQSDQ